MNTLRGAGEIAAAGEARRSHLRSVAQQDGHALVLGDPDRQVERHQASQLVLALGVRALNLEIGGGEEVRGSEQSMS